MKAKSLLIPIAAFALTATTASAFNIDVLQKAGLNETQISAFETAHELRKEGDKEAAREALEEAGIDIETMETVRKAMHEYKHEMRDAMHTALEANDYDAFKDAIEGSPLADIITSESDFEQFKEAHDLRKEGEIEAAKEIMESLGFEGKPFSGHMGRGGHMHKLNGFRGGGTLE